MKQIKVLVTGSGSLYGVAVVQSLTKSPLNCKVVCCDTDPITLGLYLADQGYLIPSVKERDQWLKQIIEICLKEEIDGIFIGSSHEIETFAQNSHYINSCTGAKVFVNPKSVVEKCQDKWQTVQFLKNEGFHCPETIRWPEDKSLLNAFLVKVGFPVVAKPRIGAGSEGIAILNSEQQLSSFIKGKVQYIIQEYLPENNGEFTVGVCLASKGKVLSSIALRRTLKDGMTMVAVADHYAALCQYCEQVAKAIKAYGPINLQLRIKNGLPYIFEINPRFSSSTGMRIALGVNEAELLIRAEILGETVTKPTIIKAGVIRQYQDYVIRAEQMGKFSTSKWFEIPSRG
ncbi:ATP-grasp domain-containing protein [Peptococcaceae bacterium 1198_IL3148]